jgi:predicted secreted acid phosphatase
MGTIRPAAIGAAWSSHEQRVVRSEPTSATADTFVQQLRNFLIQVLTVCTLVGAQNLSPTFAESVELSQPPNVGDAKLAAVAYHKSGAYERDLAAVAAQVSAWLAERAPQVSRPALVLDIDDTVLSNWEVIMADDFGRVFDGPCRSLPKGPCGWIDWDLRGKTPAIPQTLAVFRQARSLGIAVFFISGRDESQRAATIRNLRLAGFAGYRGLYMETKGSHYPSAADFKAPQRKRIEQAGYTIIANVGDQPSDLAGGYGEKTFLLPNPFYRIP